MPRVIDAMPVNEALCSELPCLQEWCTVLGSKPRTFIPRALRLFPVVWALMKRVVSPAELPTNNADSC